MKKLLSVVLSLILLAALLPATLRTASADVSGQCGEDLYWTYDAVSRALTITGTGRYWDYYDTLDGLVRSAHGDRICHAAGGRRTRRSLSAQRIDGAQGAHDSGRRGRYLL